MFHAENVDMQHSPGFQKHVFPAAAEQIQKHELETLFCFTDVMQKTQTHSQVHD